MSDYLEDATESGFRIYGEKIQAPFSNEDLTDLLEAYTSRILAKQQAAHDAEIARLKEEYDELDRHYADELAEGRQLRAACAMKDEALGKIASDTKSSWEEDVVSAQYALSATSQQVSEWERKQLEPLLAQVAMLRWTIDVMQHNSTNMRVKLASEALSNTQSASEAFIFACEQRGAVKALEDAADKVESICKWWASECAAYMRERAAELRATSKKAGL